MPEAGEALGPTNRAKHEFRRLSKRIVTTLAFRLAKNRSRRMPMYRKVWIGGLSAVALAFVSTALAQQGAPGTAAEAKAMLERAVVAVKADKAKALDMFIKGEGGFKDRDLYPFCFSVADGKVLAGPPFVIGKDIRTFKDSTGKEFGKENYKAAIEGKFSEVSYLFPRTNGGSPVPKVSFITGVGDLGCGVGYYP
jgi:hypothetical protein